MHNLVVNAEFAASVIDHEDANAAAAVVEGMGKAVDEAALVDDRKTLLDVTSLGHGNNFAVVTDVKNTVLLEDRTQHVLDNDRWRWVRDEARLLV